MTQPTAADKGSGVGSIQPGTAVEQQLREQTAELKAALNEAQRIIQALRESEAQFRSMADHSLLGISIITEGKYAYTNAVQNESFGYSADEMLLLDPLATIAPSDRAVAAEMLGQALASEIDRAELTLRAQRKNGTSFDVEISGSSMMVNGKRSLVVLTKDITKRTTAERRLRESEEVLRTVTDSAYDAILMMDDEGRITFWNEAAEHMFGHGRSEAIGQDSHVLLLAPQYRQLYREAFATFRETRQGAAVGALRELSAMRKDGTEFPIEISLSALKLEGKWHAVGIVRDITERSLLERERGERSGRAHAQANALFAITAAEKKFNNDIDALFRAITGHLVRATGVERASIWLFNEERTRLHCTDLYESASAGHSAGVEVSQEQFAAELRLLKSVNYLAADDAVADPRTADYAEAYLKPFGIRALLHSAVEVSGKYLGVLCLEYVHQTHHWEDDEIAFAAQVAGRVGLALLARSRWQAERAHHESERRLSSILDNVELISVILDRDGTLMYCNDYLLRISGWQREEIIGRRWGELFRPRETVAELRDIFSELLSGKPGARHHRSRILMRDGEFRTVSWSNTLLCSPDGDVIGTASLGQDITEQEAAEKNLQLFRTLIDQSNDAIHVIDAQTMRLLDVNDRACKDLGYSREELLSLAVFDFEVNDDPMWIEKTRKRLEECGFLVTESNQKRKDGTLFPVELSLRLIVLDKPYIVSAVRDITERKAAEHNLRLFRTLIDQSNDAIEVIDAQTRHLIDVNERTCTDLGYSREELLQLSVLDIDGSDNPDTIDEVQDRLEKEGSVMIESVHRRKDRTRFPVELSFRLVVLERPYIVCTARDITERKRAEGELQALQQQLREQSIHDPLTGLYNRRYLEEALARELLVAERKGYCVSAIMGDLDHFKRVNDEYGHRAGDEVLRTFGRLMKSCSRGSDVDCRYGGEEFLLLLPDMDEKAAVERAESLRAALAARPVQFEGASIAVTGSFGVASFPADARTGDKLVGAADKALYAAKNGGRNRVARSSAVDAGA